MLHDIFGNPYRPIDIPSVWLTPIVLSLAQAAYEERNLPTGKLDNARLAILADALDPDFPDGSVVSAWRLRISPEKPSVS
jgi:hypothetical protein